MRRKTILALWTASFFLLGGMAGSELFTWIGSRMALVSFLKNSADASEIAEISVESLTEKIWLKKLPEGWALISPEEYPADTAAVEALIKSFTAAVLEDRISGAGSVQQYELDEARSLKLTVKDKKGQILAQGKVGKTVPGNYERCYFWPAGSEDIHMLRLPRYQLDLKAPALKNRLILSAPKDKIASLELHRGREKLEFIPIADSWKINGRQGRAEKVSEIVDPLHRLEAVDFASIEKGSLKKMGLEDTPKTLSLTINLSDGKSYSLWVGEKKDSYYFAKLASKPTVWRVAEWNISPMLMPVKDLILAPTPEKPARKNR